MSDPTNTLFVLLALSCSLSGVAGCSCFEQFKTSEFPPALGQTDRWSFDQGGAIVARGASPEGVVREATPIQLGLPTPILTTEYCSDDKPCHAGAENTGTLCESEFSWQSDASLFLAEFRGDLQGLCTRENALFLLAAGGVSFAVHESFDDDLAENTARHRNRWGKAQDFFGGIGNPAHQLTAISGLYAFSLLQNDVEAHELSKSLFSAVAITEVSTTLLKLAANSSRPNGDSYGWPSGHTSSSFAFASVLNEYYGHYVGLPAYAVAGLVAWERIDDREHDLSDVVFGAALGYVIGRTVAREHQCRFWGMQLQPYADPDTRTNGIAIEGRF